MRLHPRPLLSGLFIASLLTSGLARAGDAPQAWQVSKRSGDVWVVTQGVQSATLSSDTSLAEGDSIRTGSTGRVLLTRGQETILIAPNSVVAIPAQKADSTTIVQQAGSILLEVNKRDTRSFEVETPYLVAAVKGTQFRVTVGAQNADVSVQHGSVEVADVKTGKFALVMPGQGAHVSSGAAGLTLHGTGSLNPIKDGPARGATVIRVPVPRNGLAAPAAVRAGLQVRALSVASRATGSGLRI